MQSSAGPAAAAAAPSSRISTAQGGAAGAASVARLRSEILANAARVIEADTPWYETLGLRCGEVVENGGDAAVAAVLAINVVSGLIDAANETLLAPVFVLLKGLLGAVQGAAAAREEIVELARYCVGISRCLLEAARVEHMPSTIVATLGEFRGEMDAVVRFTHTYGTRTGCFFRRIVFNSHDRNTVAGHKQKLKDLLDAVLAGLAAQAYRGVQEIKTMIIDRDPPPLPNLAEVPREAPILPPTYVQRSEKEQVALDLMDSHRSPYTAHYVLGMGGAGKTLLASSVVRDDRVRATFKDGMFWVTVGREGENLALLLEYLAVELARTPTDTPHSCPHRFNSAEEAERHLSAVRKRSGLRCLVVLDNVWSVEVVNAVARTGFHVLVTTRQRAVVSPAHAGVCTEVGDMSEADALEVLRKASQAAGPLPADAAQVADDCGFLPLALGMVGYSAREQPLDPISWRRLHDKLQQKSVKIRQLENGKLFSTIETSLHGLPRAQQEQLQLMAVMPSGVAATPEMLANLWDQHISDVGTGANILVGHCLLQNMPQSYRLHDLVLEYLQLVIKMDVEQTFVRRASSRQAQYLGRLDVLERHYSRGETVSTGGIYSLVSLWNSVKKLDPTVDVQARYMESLNGVREVRPWKEAGRLLMKLGHYASAEAILKEGLRAIGDLDSEHAEVSAALYYLTAALHEQGKFREADILNARMIEAHERRFGPDDPNLAQFLVIRADGLTKQGHDHEAHLLYQRAMEIEEKALGSDHPSLARYITSQAHMLSGQGKDKEAALLCLRAIEIKEKHVGPDHPSLATSLGVRAMLLAKQGDYNGADPLFRRAIQIDEKALGNDHPRLVPSLSNLANMFLKQGKHTEADQLYLRAIDIQEKHQGSGGLSLALNLANRARLKTAQGKHEEADVLRLRVIEIEEEALGPDHPRLARSLCNRAGALLQRGRLDDARPALEKALAIRRKTLADGHKDTINVINDLKLLGEMQGLLPMSRPSATVRSG